jgi:hypothetical protein
MVERVVGERRKEQKKAIEKKKSYATWCIIELEKNNVSSIYIALNEN